MQQEQPIFKADLHAQITLPDHIIIDQKETVG